MQSGRNGSLMYRVHYFYMLILTSCPLGSSFSEARIPNPMKEKSNEILKIGHGGTLDNSASRVLDWITKEALENVLQKFTRNIIYSALKKDGQRLSTLVRKGESVEPKPARPVTVYSLTLKNLKPPLFTFVSLAGRCWG
ncbi:pseudouridylate synthase TRUB1 isoform X3 [Pogona vitticeps]